MPASGSQINGLWGNFTCVSDVQSQLDGGTVKVWSYILLLMYYDVTLHRVRYQESIRKSVFPVSFFSHFFCGTSMRSKQTKFENTWRCLLYLAANFQFLTQLSSTQQKLSESAECWIPIAHRPSPIAAWEYPAQLSGSFIVVSQLRRLLSLCSVIDTCIQYPVGSVYLHQLVILTSPKV